MRYLVLLVLALAATACPADEDGDGSNYVAVADMPAAYKEAYCTYLARCGVFPDQATCVSAALAVVPTIDPNIAAAVATGRVIYNGSNVKACFDAVANDTCDSTDENGRAHVPECGVYFQGTVAGGDMCMIDQECISQNCSGGATGSACVFGTCIGDTPPVNVSIPVGMPCGSSNGCVDGAYCDTLTSVCTTLKANGEACTGGAECGYGLACGGPTGMRTCQALPALGQACRLDLPCRDEGQYCNTTTMTCAQVGVPGALCTSSMQCSPYYRCDTTAGACAKVPSIGQPCTAGTRCFEAGSFCDSSTLVCVAARTDGETCMSDLQCESETCDFEVATPVCASPPICF
jgi:hypothetical protein